jgi:hypothetical protein
LIPGSATDIKEAQVQSQFWGQLIEAGENQRGGEK